MAVEAIEQIIPETVAVRQEYLTPKQAADYLGVAQQTMYNWRSRREGPPALRMGERYLRYKRSDLDQWVAGGGR
ncbi:DNA-binding protein [Parvularcula marina]|uniref:DNA-binding protein n=2 Tax=Parvularcula marina TaxID=2292771 RepID=A0A371RLY0_9PROT|nr:DNA-binding protein [Parvularcula marina]